VKYPVKHDDAERVWACGQQRSQCRSKTDNQGQASFALSLSALSLFVEFCHFQMEPLATLFHREVESPSLVLHLLSY
jgi:hypothetical protein